MNHGFSGSRCWGPILPFLSESGSIWLCVWVGLVRIYYYSRVVTCLFSQFQQSLRSLDPCFSRRALLPAAMEYIRSRPTDSQSLGPILPYLSASGSIWLCVCGVWWEYITVVNGHIANISVTSPIVINMPTRELLAGKTRSLFVKRKQIS